MTHTLDELKRLCSEATAGPWEGVPDYLEEDGSPGPAMILKGPEYVQDYAGTKIPGIRDTVAVFGYGAHGRHRSNMAMIIASRTALPELIAELEAARQRADGLAAQVGEWRAALEHIAQGAGPYSNDQFEFACNVIQQSRDIANEALAQPPSALEAEVAAARALADAVFMTRVEVDAMQGDTTPEQDREYADKCEAALEMYCTAKEAAHD